MSILIAYPTSEGQTEKVTAFMRERLLAGGHQVTTGRPGVAEGPSLADADRVLVAASLHAGSRQSEAVDFAKRRAGELDRLQALILSVSLSAAGRDRADLEAHVARLERQTGWPPARVAHVTGAFRSSRFGWRTRPGQKWIAWRRGQSTDSSHGLALTGWAAVARFCSDLVQDREVAATAAPGAAAGHGSP
jgi:menaquinone-dependent protoporphyrinogen oxidase